MLHRQQIFEQMRPLQISNLLFIRLLLTNLLQNSGYFICLCPLFCHHNLLTNLLEYGTPCSGTLYLICLSLFSIIKSVNFICLFTPLLKIRVYINRNCVYLNGLGNSARANTNLIAGETRDFNSRGRRSHDNKIN